MNEWDPKYTGGAWRQKIDSQRGAVLATEVKNNSGKFAKWVAQSLLSGVDLMKVGYVSRVTASNPYDHVLLATQIFKPKELATQINLTLANVWGIVKMMCDILLKKEDGKYVILKDPSKPVIRVYAVPMNTFEEEYEEEEEEEEDDEEAEVDGEEDVAEDPEEVIMVVVE